jgi:hypothetical protein
MGCGQSRVSVGTFFPPSSCLLRCFSVEAFGLPLESAGSKCSTCALNGRARLFKHIPLKGAGNTFISKNIFTSSYVVSALSLPSQVLFSLLAEHCHGLLSSEDNEGYKNKQSCAAVPVSSSINPINT